MAPKLEQVFPPKKFDKINKSVNKSGTNDFN